MQNQPLRGCLPLADVFQKGVKMRNTPDLSLIRFRDTQTQGVVWLFIGLLVLGISIGFLLRGVTMVVDSFRGCAVYQGF
jgi:hypothetical protein